MPIYSISNKFSEKYLRKIVHMFLWLYTEIFLILVLNTWASSRLRDWWDGINGMRVLYFADNADGIKGRQRTYHIPYTHHNIHRMAKKKKEMSLWKIRQKDFRIKINIRKIKSFTVEKTRLPARDIYIHTPYTKLNHQVTNFVIILIQ